MAASPDWPADPRFRVAHNIPRAFDRTGLIALTRAVAASDAFRRTGPPTPFSRL